MEPERAQYGALGAPFDDGGAPAEAGTEAGAGTGDEGGGHRGSWSLVVDSREKVRSGVMLPLLSS